MVVACKLPVVHFDFCLRCAEAKSKDLEQVGHALTNHGEKFRIIEPLFWFVGDLCGGVVLLRHLGVWRLPCCLIIAVRSVFSWRGSGNSTIE